MNRASSTDLTGPGADQPGEQALDRLRFSALAHREHRFGAPLANARAHRLCSLLELEDSDLVLDVGCGKATFLCDIVERYRCRGIGIDRSPYMIEEAARQAEQRKLRERVDIQLLDARECKPPPALSAALCIGATDAFGDLRNTLHQLREWVRPGGVAVVGECFWAQTPTAEYLSALGAFERDYQDHAGNATLAMEQGWTVLFTSASNSDEWDEYEGLYLRSIERFVRENPADPEAAAMRDRVRAWHRVYLKWGRSTLGFGYYVLRRDDTT